MSGREHQKKRLAWQHNVCHDVYVLKSADLHLLGGTLFRSRQVPKPSEPMDVNDPTDGDGDGILSLSDNEELLELLAEAPDAQPSMNSAERFFALGLCHNVPSKSGRGVPSMHRVSHPQTCVLAPQL